LNDSVIVKKSLVENSVDAGFNGKLVKTKVKDDLNKFICKEELSYRDNQNISRKLLSLETDLGNGRSVFYRLDKVYAGKNLEKMVYPFEYMDGLLSVVYTYNKQGLVSSIGFGNETSSDLPNYFAFFDYTPSGCLSKESFYDANNKENKKSLFNREYVYNSPGFLTQINDAFQEESISYNEDGYGQSEYYDGTISKTQFKPKWHTKCDSRLLFVTEAVLIEKLASVKKLNQEEAEYLLEILMKNGYLDKNYRVIKQLLVPEAMNILPIFFDELVIKKLIEILDEYFPVHDYGHRYSYGTHTELMNSKYFIHNENSKIDYDPINPTSFSRIHSKSEFIWDLLVNNYYIYPDSYPGCDFTFGKVEAYKWIDDYSLRSCLQNAGFSAGYTMKLLYWLQYNYIQKKVPSKEEFSKTFTYWLINHKYVTDLQKGEYIKAGAALWEVLNKANYFYNANNSNSALFKKSFIDLLKDNRLSNILPEIVGVLFEKSKHQIGTSSCDLRCYELDQNGNHKLFWKGFMDRYQLKYAENSNQVTQLDHNSNSYRLEYDNCGNVIRAEHHGIEKIVYDLGSNRALRFVLKNGTKVLFNYDSNDERVYKCVLDSNDKKLKEIFYLRDHKGRTLVEKEIIYDEKQNAINEYFVAYVYGPRGLIGFIKNNEFYNVLTDHQFSTRLIVKDMEVVAAFDYLPYGGLIRKCGIEADNIRYLFTGQEYDQELGLYNYHARFYDPLIGRFYQVIKYFTKVFSINFKV
jgi:hypothetical protein